MKVINLLIAFLTVTCFCSIGLVSAAEETADKSQASEMAAGETDASEVKTVNVNEADAETIASVLKGVGQSKAEAIVQYRTDNGRFYSAEELTAVRGIGMATVAKNEDRIIVD